MPNPSSKTVQPSQRIVLGLVGCVLVTVALILGIGSRVLRHSSAAFPPEVVFDPVRAQQAWRDTVLMIGQAVTPTSSDAEVQRAIDRILALRVTVAEQDMHLQLVLALSARQRNEAGASERLATLIQRITQQP